MLLNFHRFANTLAGYLKEVKTFLGGDEKISVRRHRGTNVGSMRIPMDMMIDSPPKNKTKVAADMHGGVHQYAEEGFDDIYGESSSGGLVGGVKRRPTLSFEKLDKIGVDVVVNGYHKSRKLDDDGTSNGD